MKIRKSSTYLIAVATLSVLTACGGGGGGGGGGGTPASGEVAAVANAAETTPTSPSAVTPAVTPPVAAVALNKWCWSMASGNIRGTFLTTEALPGNGTANAGVYTVSGFSVDQSGFGDLELGSVADGTYAFGSQPSYQVQWDGTAATGFWSASGGYKFGFSVYNGAGGSGATLAFTIGQGEAITAPSGGTLIYRESATPTFAPVGVTGKCAGEA